MKKKIIFTIILVIIPILLIYTFINPFTKFTKILNGNSIGEIRVDARSEYVQNITIEDDYVIGFNIIPRYNSRNTPIEYKIYNEEGSLVYYNVLESIFKKNGNSFLFKTPAINKAGKNYSLHIRVINEEDKIYFDKLNDNSIVLSQITKTSNYKPCFLILFLYIIILIIYFYKYNTKLKNVKKLVPFFSMIVYYLLNILFSYNLLFIIYRSSVMDIHLYSVFLEIILAIVITYIGTNKFKRNKKDISILFLIISIPIFCLYCALFKPGDGQDEYRHYARAYMMATKQIADENGYVEIPEIIAGVKLSNNNELFDKIKAEYSYENVRKTDYAGYNQISYIIPSGIILLCKQFNFNPYIGWIGAKIANLTLTLVIGFLLIRYSSKYKLLLLTYLLIPMNIYQLVTLSADTAINLAALTLLVISLKKYFHPLKLKWYEYILFIFCSYTVYISKIVYLPLIFLSIFLMRKSLCDKKEILKILGCLIIIFSPKIIFNNTSVLPVTNNFLFTDNHIKMTLFHPLKTLSIFVDYIFISCDSYLLDFIGIGFNWSSLYVPSTFALGYLIVLIFSSLNSNDERKIKKIDILAIMFTFLLVFATIIVGMYAVEQRSDVILGILWGIQGRYFYPVYILLLILLSNFKNKKFPKDLSVISLILIIQLVYINYFVQYFM